MNEQIPETTRPDKPQLRRKVAYTTKAIGVTLLGVMAVSGPAVAFYDDSPILIPFLELIQQALKDALGNSLKNGFNKLVEQQIGAQVDRYKKEIEAVMMPGAFCEADVAKPVATAGIGKTVGLDEAKGAFVLTGADTLVNGHAAVNARRGLPARNPVAVIAQHNKEVRQYNLSAVCKPYQAAPVDASGTNIKCSQEERRVAAAVLLGAAPPPELANAEQAGALGEVYESARTTMIARKQLAALALSDTSNTQKQASITAYRQALDKPTIEEMQMLTADGAGSRDELVLKQVTARLLLEYYVEQLETKRLLGVYVAQRAESEERKLLSPLRRANAN